MPPTAHLLPSHSVTAPTTAPARRRRRRTEPQPVGAVAALQRALDRRDNGGATGH
ncbi:hypothetical protein [Kitasatospora sp. LaBMicrA B282]|uniref:hypothetical protein n=1 Tax=Kitasatospora sp. LaBMicrA B282 TaxID=3420949 RepID=UPI003D136609